MPTRIRAHPVGYPIRPRVDKAEIEITLDKLLKTVIRDSVLPLIGEQIVTAKVWKSW